MLVVILMKYREGVADSENDSEEKEEDGRQASLQAGMEELLRKEMPTCHAILLGVLKEPIWTGRAQFVGFGEDCSEDAELLRTVPDVEVACRQQGHGIEGQPHSSCA